MKAIKDFFRRDWSVAEKVLVAIACALFGLVWGFLCAPAKKKSSCCNHNNYLTEDDADWEDAD